MKARLAPSAGVLVLCVLIVGTIVCGLPGGPAQAATLSSAEAVSFAIQYAQRPAPPGHMVSEPSQANAQQLTLEVATQLKQGRPLQPGTRLAAEAGRQVWLVFLRGDIAVNSMPAPGRAVSSPAVYQQMSVILDAMTGDLLSIGMHPPGSEVEAAASLPQVAIPSGVARLRAPAIGRPTEEAHPTLAVPGAVTTDRQQTTTAPPGAPPLTPTPAP